MYSRDTSSQRCYQAISYGGDYSQCTQAVQTCYGSAKYEQEACFQAVSNCFSGGWNSDELSSCTLSVFSRLKAYAATVPLAGPTPSPSGGTYSDIFSNEATSADQGSGSTYTYTEEAQSYPSSASPQTQYASPYTAATSMSASITIGSSSVETMVPPAIVSEIRSMISGFGPFATDTPSTVASSASTGNPKDASDSRDGVPSSRIIAAAGIPVVVLLVVLGTFVFLCLRRRRRHRRQMAQRFVAQEMKPQSPEGHSGVTYTVPSSIPPPVIRRNSPPPVVIGPLSSGGNTGYYTGIDTSDVLSMHDVNRIRSPFGDEHEEPPPPYRPRSTAPTISRETSCRQAPLAQASSETHLIPEHNQPHVSPFADPRDDDTLSVISLPAGEHLEGRQVDEMSVVSDLSYQHDRTIAHQPM